MDEVYRERFRRHAKTIGEMADNNRRAGIIDKFDSRQMRTIGQIGEDIWKAFRRGCVVDPAIGQVLGHWKWGNMVNANHSELLTQSLRRFWYSLNRTAKFEVELVDRCVTEQAAIDRFYDETIDLVDLITFLANPAPIHLCVDDLVSSLLDTLESHNPDDGESNEALFVEVCRFSCVDNTFDPFIDELIEANYPYHENATLASQVASKVYDAVSRKSANDNPESSDAEAGSHKPSGVLAFESFESAGKESRMSKLDIATDLLSRALPWTTSIQLETLNREFKRLQDVSTFPVWLTVCRGNSGYDPRTKTAKFARDETLHMRCTALPTRKQGAPVVAIFHPPARKAERPQELADAVNDSVSNSEATTSLRISTRAFELAKTAGDVCSDIDLPWLDVGRTDNLAEEVRWVCVLHHMLHEGLLRGVDAGLRCGAMPCTDPTKSAQFLTDREPNNCRSLDLRLMGMVWHIPDFIQMSVNATAILARIAKESDSRQSVVIDNSRSQELLSANPKKIDIDDTIILRNPKDYTTEQVEAALPDFAMDERNWVSRDTVCKRIATTAGVLNSSRNRTDRGPQRRFKNGGGIDKGHRIWKPNTDDANDIWYLAVSLRTT
tara:strand:- start:216913 stop:218739 length:1827 start_codon:yes stop_codon:yes gene_type:complete